MPTQSPKRRRETPAKAAMLAVDRAAEEWLWNAALLDVGIANAIIDLFAEDIESGKFDEIDRKGLALACLSLLAEACWETDHVKHSATVKRLISPSIPLLIPADLHAILDLQKFSNEKIALKEYSSHKAHSCSPCEARQAGDRPT